MQWFVSGREVFIGHELPVKVERIDPPPPFGEEKLQLSKLLSEGVLHGAVVLGDSGYLGFFCGGSTPPMMAKYPCVKPLFEDNEEIIRYTKQTGINPIMHVLALRREIVERYPDFPAKLALPLLILPLVLSSDCLHGYPDPKRQRSKTPPNPRARSSSTAR